MLTKITDELWLDLDRIIRVAVDGDEVKYTIDFKERNVTYCVPLGTGCMLLNVLDELRLRNLRQEVKEFITKVEGQIA